MSVGSSWLQDFYVLDKELASRKNSKPETKALVRWLKSIQVDQDTIDKVTLTDYL